MSVPSDLSPRVGLAALALCCLVAASGCKAKQAGSAREPTSADAVAQDASAADPLAQLAQLEGQMRSLGLQPGTGAAATGAATPGADADAGAGDGEAELDEGAAMDGALGEDSVEEAPAPEPASPSAPMEAEASDAGPTKGNRAERRQAERCEDLCSLNEAICELELSICALAQDHAGDPTYADACARASEDCEISSDACDACAC